MVKKGASSLVVIFIVMVVSLLAASWFQASEVSGTGIQQQVVEQSAKQDFMFDIESAQLFISEGFATSLQKGTQEAANLSGRKNLSEEARYWVCKGSNQIPTKKVVRNTTGNTTYPYLQEYLNQAHKASDKRILEVGNSSCVEAGYGQNLGAPNTTEVPGATVVDSMELSTTDGELSISQEDVTLESDASRNRFWYLYQQLRNWAKNEDKKNEVLEELRDVPDEGRKEKETDCRIEGGDEEGACEYVDTGVCPDNEENLEEAVQKGLEKEMTKLENNYFSGENIKCTFEHNKLERGGAPERTYPGFDREINVDKDTCGRGPHPQVCNNTGEAPGASSSVNMQSGDRIQASMLYNVDQHAEPGCTTGECGSGYTCVNGECQQEDDEEDDEEDDGDGEDGDGDDGDGDDGDDSACGPDGHLINDPDDCEPFIGITKWDVKYTAYLDYTVTCTDLEYDSIPRDDALENQKWSIDLSYKVEENTFTGGSLDGCRQDTGNIEPHQLDYCNYQDQNPDVCDLPPQATP